MIFETQSVTLKLLTGVDLSTATSPKILFEKPNGETGEWTATVDGEQIIYTTNNTDLDRHGVWKLIGFVQISSLNKFSREAKLTVDHLWT